MGQDFARTFVLAFDRLRLNARIEYEGRLFERIFPLLLVGMGLDGCFEIVPKG